MLRRASIETESILDHYIHCSSMPPDYVASYMVENRDKKQEHIFMARIRSHLVSSSKSTKSRILDLLFIISSRCNTRMQKELIHHQTLQLLEMFNTTDDEELKLKAQNLLKNFENFAIPSVELASVKNLLTCFTESIDSGINGMINSETNYINEAPVTRLHSQNVDNTQLPCARCKSESNAVVQTSPLPERHTAIGDSIVYNYNPQTTSTLQTAHGEEVEASMARTSTLQTAHGEEVEAYMAGTSTLQAAHGEEVKTSMAATSTLQATHGEEVEASTVSGVQPESTMYAVSENEINSISDIPLLECPSFITIDDEYFIQTQL